MYFKTENYKNAIKLVKHGLDKNLNLKKVTLSLSLQAVGEFEKAISVLALEVGQDLVKPAG